MNFGINDDNLKSYRKKFLNAGKAFILKDIKIRRKRRTIPIPEAQNKGVDSSKSTVQVGTEHANIVVEGPWGK